MQLRELIKNNLSVLIIMLVTYLLTYILNVYIARILLPSSYGDVSITLRALAILVLVALLGTQLASGRFLSRYHGVDFVKFLGFYKWEIRIFKISALTVWLIVFLVYLITLLLHLFKIIPLTDYHPATFALWVIPLFGFTMLQGAFLQATKNYIISSALTIFYPITMMVLIFLLHKIDSTIDVYQIVSLMGLSYLPIILFQRILILRTLKIIKAQGYYTPDFTEKGVWLLSSLGLMLNSFIALAVNSSYIFMLEILGSNEHEVGYFSAIYVIAGIIYVATCSVDYIVNPLISPLLGKGEITELLKLFVRTMIIKCVFVCFLLTIIILKGHQLLGHFGPRYIIYYPELIIVACIFSINAVTAQANGILLYAGKQKVLNLLYILEMILVLLLCFIFIPKYDLAGAIIAMIISLGLFSFIYLVVALLSLKKMALNKNHNSF